MEDGAEVRGLDPQHKGDEDPGGGDGRWGAKAEPTGGGWREEGGDVHG